MTDTREDIDYGQVTESLNDKLDRDFSNSIVPMDFIVATKSATNEDPTWFRMYKSGWIEQGGTINVNYNNSSTQVIFPKEFKNTNYSISLSIGGFVSSGVIQTSWENKTSTTFDIHGDYSANGGTGTYPTNWIARGYAKDSMEDEESGETVYGNTYKIYKGVYPDYNNGITIQSTDTTSGSYVAPNDGEIQVYMIPATGTSTFKINGVDMGAQKRSTSGSYAVFNQAHVQKGDTITWTTSVSSQIQAYFYPFKDIDAEMNLADDSEVVHLDGDETIEGTKTFITTPIVGTLATSNNSTSAASTEFVIDVLKAIYPVGSIYIGTQTTCPMSTFFGTWELVSAGKALWTGNGSNANTTIDAGLPGHTHYENWIFSEGIRPISANLNHNQDAGQIKSIKNNIEHWSDGNQDISPKGTMLYTGGASNSIYGKSNTVQPPAYVVNVWRRTA